MQDVLLDHCLLLRREIQRLHLLIEQLPVLFFVTLHLDQLGIPSLDVLFGRLYPGLQLGRHVYSVLYFFH